MMKRVMGAIAGGVALLMSVSVVLAQEASPTPTTAVDVPAVEVDTNVATPGTFGDFMQRFNERMQLLMTRDQERKANLEFKFAARRESQLEKCSQLASEENKQKCIERVTQRSDKLYQRLEDRAEHIQNQRQALKAKIEAARQRRLEKLEELRQRQGQRLEDFQQRQQERFEMVKERVASRAGDRLEQMEERREDRIERVEDRRGKRLERIENRQEERDDEDEDEEEDEDEDGVVSSPVPLPAAVRGVTTYQPDLLEVIENWLDGVFGR